MAQHSDPPALRCLDIAGNQQILGTSANKGSNCAWEHARVTCKILLSASSSGLHAHTASPEPAAAIFSLLAIFAING
eukprot:764752-Hanusia_phi.AAC.4